SADRRGGRCVLPAGRAKSGERARSGAGPLLRRLPGAQRPYTALLDAPVDRLHRAVAAGFWLVASRLIAVVRPALCALLAARPPTAARLPVGRLPEPHLLPAARVHLA